MAEAWEEPTRQQSEKGTMTKIHQRSPSLLSSLLLLLVIYLRPSHAIPRPVAGTSWQLHSIALPVPATAAGDTIDSEGNHQGTGLYLSPVAHNTQIRALFGDDGSQAAGTLTGSGGCNDYFTDFVVDLSTMGISFDDVVATEMDCGEDVMKQENAYFEVLGKTRRHEIFGDKLKLRDESGTVILVFVPLDLLREDSTYMDGDASTEANNILVGTEWRVTSYAVEDASANLVPILTGSEVTLAFESDANFNGRGGCNSYFGSYMYASSAFYHGGGNSGRLSIFELGSAEMGCIDPPGLMDQEMAYFKALQNVHYYRWMESDDGGSMKVLLLLDYNENVALTLVPAATEDLDLNQGFSGIDGNNSTEIGLDGGIEINNDAASGDADASSSAAGKADALVSLGTRTCIISWVSLLTFLCDMVESIRI